MILVAGIGYIRRPDKEELEKLGIPTTDLEIGHNAVVVCNEDKINVVTKASPATNEEMTPGSGVNILHTRTNQSLETTIGVAICLDFIRQGSKLRDERPDIVIIPALSRHLDEFVDQTPRDFLRVFANHAAFGGTYVGAPEIKGASFVDKNGTIPLPRLLEGIVIVDWDHDNRFSTKPSATTSTDHRLFARASMIYSGRDPRIADALTKLAKVPSEDLIRVEDLFELAVELRTSLEGKRKRFDLLRDSLNVVEEQSDLLSEYELSSLSRHCVMSSNILALNEWKYLQCVRVTERLKPLLDAHIPEIVSAPFGEYSRVAREVAQDVRSSLLEWKHKNPDIDVGHKTGEQKQLVFYARLGPYAGEMAFDSMPKQLTLLRAFADLQNSKIAIKYRLQTWLDASNVIRATYEIICTASETSRTLIEELRQGLGQLIHITFTGAYSISYTTEDIDAEEALLDLREVSSWWVEIRRSLSESRVPKDYRGFADWGLIIDLLRSLDKTVTVELLCTVLEPKVTAVDLQTESDPIDTNDNSATARFETLLKKEQGDNRRLLIRVFVGSSEQIPDAVVKAIASELSGASEFDIIKTNESWNLDNDFDLRNTYGLSPIKALQIFHPPFGTIYPTAGDGRFDLSLPTNETQFPSSGILLGTANSRQVRSDREVEVRINEIDRLRHTYIVGRTGTGKTNLLKLMASQDIQVQGRGVTILDPHGDLVDHVLREIPQSRIEEVTLLDLARTDALPVLNPLDLDNVSNTVRDRTIQELILLLHSRVFHQYTGPRFDELVRLVFYTMLDEGYPWPASFVEVPRILMDRKLQNKFPQMLVDEELKERWSFQDELRRDAEHGGLIHWITSKFDDITRDSTLRCVMGGTKSTIKIEEIIEHGGILLVRIPEAVIGKQAADFIGSLILLKLRMAIMRKREFGKLQNFNFVYVDEFQNFANTDFHTLVAEARKFNIGFTLSNQNLDSPEKSLNHQLV